jgi:hypothetical protein
MKLAASTEGDVNVTALFAIAFVLGLMVYLMGLGDAAIHHEAMQDAADGAALGPAILHARGMNVIAFTNLVMTAVVSVLAAVKTVQMLLLAANIIACALPVNPYCPLLSSWQDPYAKFVKIVDKTVSTMNRGLYASESAIGRSIPIMAQAKARAGALAYAPRVESGFYAGLSLVPGTLDRGSLGFEKPGASIKANVRSGLPVEDEPYEDLCVQASNQIDDLVFRPLVFLPGANVIIQPVMKYAGNLVSKFTKAFPKLFCGGGLFDVTDLGDFGKELLKKGAATVAKEACKAATSSVPGATTYGNLPVQLPSCTEGVTAGLGALTSPSAILGKGQTTKRIHRPAVIGSDYYASYGFALSSALDKDDKDAQLNVISLRRLPRDLGKTELERIMTSMQFSKSEMYFEPRGAGPSSWLPKGRGTFARDEALLHPRWRARLRRFRPPPRDARDLLTGPGLGAILSSIGGGVSPSLYIRVTLGQSPGNLSRFIKDRLGPGDWSTSTGGCFH